MAVSWALVLNKPTYGFCGGRTATLNLSFLSWLRAPVGASLSVVISLMRPACTTPDLTRAQLQSGPFSRLRLVQSKTIESRRDQEEGGELDFDEEVSPEEIKSREVVLG